MAPAAALARIGRALHGGAGRGDEQLVALVGAGDERAFEEIVDRYGAGLLSFCVHMLGSREWGEDALQLTLTSAYQALSRGRRPDALRPWLYTIARNRCLSELRSVREYPRSDAIVVERPELDGPPSLVARREQLRELVEDIQRLPDDQRAALVLFELGDYSHAEIASVLDVRCENVKALIFQAREGLMRGRTARESPCSEVRERMASARGKIPARGQVRAHIDRCASCRAYEHEVRRQRSALALIIPIAFSGKLKASVLSSAAHGSAGAAGVAGAGGGTAAAAGAGTGTAGFAGASAVGSASATGAVAVSGPGAVAGAAGGVSVTAAGMSAAAGGAGAAASGAGAAGVSAPAVFASALGGEAVVGTLGSSASTALVAKIATAAVAVVAAASAPKVPTSLSPPSRLVAASTTAPQPASNPAPAATAPSTGASQPAGSAFGGVAPAELLLDEHHTHLHCVLRKPAVVHCARRRRATGCTATAGRRCSFRRRVRFLDQHRPRPRQRRVRGDPNAHRRPGVRSAIWCGIHDRGTPRRAGQRRCLPSGERSDRCRVLAGTINRRYLRRRQRR